MLHEDPFLLYKPILTIMKFSGIQFPLKSSRLYITISTILFTVLVLTTLKAEESISSNHFLPKHLQLEQFDRFLLYSSLVIVLHIFVFYYTNSAKVLTVLDKLRHFDEVVSSELNVVYCTQGKAKHTTFIFIMFFILTIFVYSIRIYIYYYNYKQIHYHTVTYTYVFYLQYNVILHYFFFLSQILYRFRFLNKHILKYRETNLFLIKRFLRLIKILHEHLHEVSRDVNTIFGVYQAHVIVMSCIDEVMDCFYLFMVLKERLSKEQSIFGLDILNLLVDWFFKMSFHMFLMFTFAQKVENDVNPRNKYLH